MFQRSVWDNLIRACDPLGKRHVSPSATRDFQEFHALEQASLPVKLTVRLDLTLLLELSPGSRPQLLNGETAENYRSGFEYQF
jgi:hypothetical protein